MEIATSECSIFVIFSLDDVEVDGSGFRSLSPARVILLLSNFSPFWTGLEMFSISAPGKFTLVIGWVAKSDGDIARGGVTEII